MAQFKMKIQRSSDFGEAYVLISGIQHRSQFKKPVWTGGRRPLMISDAFSSTGERQCMSGDFFMYHRLPNDPIPPGGSCQSIEIDQ